MSPILSIYAPGVKDYDTTIAFFKGFVILSPLFISHTQFHTPSRNKAGIWKGSGVRGSRTRKGVDFMAQMPTVVQLLEAGLHFGHKRSRRHPKMEPFIFMSKNDINIIDLRLTVEMLAKALEYVKKIAEDGGSLLFVSTKKQASPLIEKYAQMCEQPFISNRWIGGTLTNFAIISKMVNTFKDLKTKRDSGDFQKYTKKEQLDFSRKIAELDHLIGGIEKMTKLPQALFVIDVNLDSTAVKEAMKKGIPIIAICDTNVNPEKATYPIPGNDDAVKSIDLILNLVAKSYNEGKASRVAGEEKKKIEAQKVEHAVEI